MNAQLNVNTTETINGFDGDSFSSLSLSLISHSYHAFATELEANYLNELEALLSSEGVDAELNLELIVDETDDGVEIIWCANDSDSKSGMPCLAELSFNDESCTFEKSEMAKFAPQKVVNLAAKYEQIFSSLRRVYAGYVRKYSSEAC
jgi:hypothetical protein